MNISRGLGTFTRQVFIYFKLPSCIYTTYGSGSTNMVPRDGKCYNDLLTETTCIHPTHREHNAVCPGVFMGNQRLRQGSSIDRHLSAYLSRVRVTGSDSSSVVNTLFYNLQMIVFCKLYVESYYKGLNSILLSDQVYPVWPWMTTRPRVCRSSACSAEVNVFTEILSFVPLTVLCIQIRTAWVVLPRVESWGYKIKHQNRQMSRYHWSKWGIGNCSRDTRGINVSEHIQHRHCQ